MGSSLHLVVRSLRIIPVFVRHESFMLHESQRGHNAIPAIFIGAIFLGRFLLQQGFHRSTQIIFHCRIERRDDL